VQRASVQFAELTNAYDELYVVRGCSKSKEKPSQTYEQAAEEAYKDALQREADMRPEHLAEQGAENRRDRRMRPQRCVCVCTVVHQQHACY
jgi:hypothetical protein